MDPLGELLTSDHRRTLEFFVMNLKDVSEPNIDQQELLYNASVLAHYAQISIDPDLPLSTPADLTAVFDHFVADANVLTDALMLETAGAQCLLLQDFSKIKCAAGTIFIGMRSSAPAFSGAPRPPSNLLRKRSCSTRLAGISSRGAGVTHGSARSFGTRRTCSPGRGRVITDASFGKVFLRVRAATSCARWATSHAQGNVCRRFIVSDFPRLFSRRPVRLRPATRRTKGPPARHRMLRPLLVPS